MDTSQMVYAGGVRSQWTGCTATERGPQFFQIMLEQAVGLLLGGEPEASRLILRDVVSGTIGFEALAALTHTSAKSLRGMLTANGRLGMDSLSVIFRVVRDWLQAALDVPSDAPDQHFCIALE